MGQSPDSGSAPASSPSGGSKPTQPITGSRGYLARLASQDARVHRRYAVPRLVPLTRACLHRPHSPGSTGSTGLTFSSLTTCVLPWVTGVTRGGYRDNRRRRFQSPRPIEARAEPGEDGRMTRVAIIGGGIGGLTAASALLRAGAEVSVYEAAGELKEIGAGVALHANAMRVLRFIGVEDAVRKVAGRSEYAVTRDGITGRLISKTSRARTAELQGIEPATVHRADLLDVLAAALPEGLVTLGKRCVAVDGDGDAAV